MDQQQAAFLMEQLTRLWEGEFPATCAVLSAVPDSGKDYKPDPKSRTAWELATHLATGDVWFLSSILSGTFVWDEEAAKKAPSMSWISTATCCNWAMRSRKPICSS